MSPRYTVLDPSGNVTILVTDPVAPADRPALAAALLARESRAEQLGFLETPGPNCQVRVCMAGGEFCGNAALCAAVLYGAQQGERSVLVGMSGAETPLRVSLQEQDGGWLGRVEMPLPHEIYTRRFSLDGESFSLPVVKLPGITHLILRQAMAPAAAERAVKLWCRELGAAALGLMMLDEAQMRLRPLVYVPGADTLYWERSCASGTAAVGAALALLQGKSLQLKLEEPGGWLGVEALAQSGRLVSLSLENRVFWSGKFVESP